MAEDRDDTEPAVAPAPGSDVPATPPETGTPPAAEDAPRGPSGTGVLPTVPPAGPPPAPPRWSARAQVRPAAAPVGQGPDWIEPGPPRGALVPVLIAVCVLLLAAFIGGGLWLALRDPGATPAPTPTRPTTIRATTPLPRTTAAPTATTEPPVTGPAVVTLPEVSGGDYETAAGKLTDLGFIPVRVEQPSTEVPAGQVIGTDPPAGTAAVPGLRVDVFVSTGPPEPTEPTEAPTSTPPA